MKTQRGLTLDMSLGHCCKMTKHLDSVNTLDDNEPFLGFETAAIRYKLFFPAAQEVVAMSLITCGQLL